jgi:hypothetical protein
MKDDKFFKLANAPEDQPLAFDLRENKLYLDPSTRGSEDPEDQEKIIPLDATHSVAQMKSTLTHSRPQWLKDFFKSMGDYVSQASGGATIDPGTGALTLDAAMPRTQLKKVVEHLAWLYEAQYRQNKEILLWIGEVILDYMARDTRDLTIEEAIEELGLLDRNNGVKWKLKTLARWPIVVQRIPAPIRQLPIPPTYLSEAALFAQPEDPDDKVKFGNARDAMLVAVAEKPDSWSRARFVNCMKELQDQFGMERQRNEGIAALQERLIAYYRLRWEANLSGDPQAFYKNNNIPPKEIASWIYNIECELISRGKMAEIATNHVPRGDGLTATARERALKMQTKKGSTP